MNDRSFMFIFFQYLLNVNNKKQDVSTTVQQSSSVNKNWLFFDDCWTVVEQLNRIEVESLRTYFVIDSNELTKVSYIPESAEQAETFYSNYNDFESDTDENDDDIVTSSSSSSSLSDVVSNNDVVDENDVTGNDDINKTDDYKALVDCMENALELGDDDIQSMFGDLSLIHI